MLRCLAWLYDGFQIPAGAASGAQRRHSGAHRSPVTECARNSDTCCIKTLDVQQNLDFSDSNANQFRLKKEHGYKHVAVLMGGWSAEREVSLRSGKACADALVRLGYRVTRIDVGRDIASVLNTVKPDVALNVLHGGRARMARCRASWRSSGFPTATPGVLASALAMQKDMAKAVFRAAGVPVPEGVVADRLEAAKQHLLPPPYVIKPIAEGSRVGVFMVTAEHAHPPQELTREDWSYGDRVIVEKYIAGKELTCAVMGEQALGVIEIVPTVRFYDYEAKYAPGGSRHLLPAPISPFVYQQVRELALGAHKALGCRGVSRADFRFDDRLEGTEGLVCLEVNTQPGMTETSLVPELAASRGHFV